MLTAPIVGVSVLLVVVSVALALSVLLHKGRGGGLSDLFGGGVSTSMGGMSSAERRLDRMTILLGLIWIVSVIVLGFLYKAGS
jgi:preprotein translocase subunit SecG